MERDYQAAANSAFNSSSFFILTGLPKASEVGIDGKYWNINAFSGFKLLPPGLHFFVFSAVASSSGEGGPSSGLRHGLLRFYEKSEVIAEEWNVANEELSSRRTKTREEVIISEAYLKSLDKELAPYPAGLEAEWGALTSFITPETLQRVVGVDEFGSAKVDGATESKAEVEELVVAERGRKTWGKERETNAEEKESGVNEEDKQTILNYVMANQKKSWPVGALGADLTRWSKDKSWYLSKVIRDDLKSNGKEYLAELELSFLLFTLLHNFSSLAIYKSIISLLCRSSSLLLPSFARDPSSSSLLSPAISLPLFASFLSAIYSQLAFLDDSFFSIQLPNLDFYLISELGALLEALSDAAPRWATVTDRDALELWKEVQRRWRELSLFSMEKFGWELGEISRRHEFKGVGQEAREEDEIDFEELEEGDDAPVFVET